MSTENPPDSPSPPAQQPVRRRRMVRWLLITTAVVALLMILADGVAMQPMTANTFGYALPGANGLPNHFTYQGISYSNPNLCAGATTCQPQVTHRYTQADLAGAGIWPLHQVATLPTLFGAAHPVLEPVNDPSMVSGPYVSDVHPFVLFVPDGAGAYYLYMRPGGP